ncbi:MAG: tetratricopeptide repeat protein [Paludibacter sp.]|nr:tetratricopeptide repeat protein [Paludibacter sp.]
MKTAERLIEKSPDSAYIILKHLKPEQYQSGSNRALYGLLMIKTLAVKTLPLGPDSLIDFSIQYYEKHNGDDRLATCYYYKGLMLYKNAFDYEKSTEYFLKSLDVLKNKSDYALQGRIYRGLADIHSMQRDYVLAREKYRLSYEYFKKAGFQPQAFYSYMDIGCTYHLAKNYKKAGEFYKTVFPLIRDSLQEGALLQEVAENYYSDKHYDSALVYFRKVVKYPVYIRTNRAIQYYYFSDLLFDVKQYDSAFYYAKSSFNYQPDIRTRRECFRIMTNIEFLKGHMKNVPLYMNQYVALNDSIRKIDAQTKGSYLEKMHNTTRAAEESGKKHWLFIGLLLLLVGATLILYLRMRKGNQLERQKNDDLLIRQKAGIHKELIHQHRDTLLHKIETIKAEQTANRKKATQAEKEELDRKLYEELLHLNNADFFYREMDVVLNNLVGKLSKRYPALTSKEITWCCLYLLQVPTIDILLLLDYKVDSLNKMKQRLAQKTGLSGVTEIDAFLNKLLTE